MSKNKVTFEERRCQRQEQFRSPDFDIVCLDLFDKAQGKIDSRLHCVTLDLSVD